VTPWDLLTANWRDEISFHPRQARPGAIWTAWGRGDSPTSTLAETLEGRKREARGGDTAAIRAPQVVEAAHKQGRLSHFPSKPKMARSRNRRPIAIQDFPG
jgi:hypothetical protein